MVENFAGGGYNLTMISNNEWGMVINEPLQRLDINRIDAIALHHMASPTADIYEVERWHLNQGWRAFGYNYWVAYDGTIYEGRGYEYMAAGVASQNDHIISIGFQGNYQSGLPGIALSPPMPDQQFNAGIDIIRYLMQRVPNIKEIGGHDDFMATACPGDTFPLAEMQTLQKRGEAQRDMFTDVPQTDYAYQHIKKLFDYGIVNGDENGNFNPDEYLTRRDAAIMLANALTYIGK